MMASRATTATSSLSAPPATQELSEHEKQIARRIFGAYAVISLALFIIVNVLGTYEILQGQDASLILGSTMIGGTLLMGATRYAVSKYIGIPSSERRWALLYYVIPIALGILGITGTLNVTQMGVAYLINGAVVNTYQEYKEAEIFKNIRQGSKIAYAFVLITIALVTINALGATGVLTGDAARIGLALGNAAGICALAAIRYKFFFHPEDPNRKLELLALIPAIILGGMGVYGTINPFVLGTGFLIASSLRFRTEYLAMLARPFTPPEGSQA